MKFTIKTENLKKGLEIVNHATAQVTTTPILENILIKVNFNNILLTSNNLEMAIEYIIEDDLKITSEGAFCIPSKLFTNYINLVNDDSIEIELIKNESLKLTTETSNLKIKGMDASDFPLIPNIKEETSLNIKGSVFKNGVEKTLFSSAEGNIRPTLAGIAISISLNKATFASTDSFRLSEYKTNLNDSNSIEFSGILPSKAASQIKNIISSNDNIKIVSADSQIVFIFSNVKIFSRLLNGKFPDYSTFFPTNFSTKAEINRMDLIWALKKINLLSRENNYSIKMNISSNNSIKLETSETQAGEGNIEVNGNIDGVDSVIGINSVYFLEVLGVIKSNYIDISFESPLSPILITPVQEDKDGNPEKKDKKEIQEEFRHIIMPLKIDKI